MKKKSVKLILIIIILFLPTYFLYEWFFGEGATKRLYYNFWHYNGDKIRIVEDEDFPFYEEGYSKIYILNSDYYVSHRVLLVPNSKSVPVDYEYKGEFLVELFDCNDNLLKAVKVDEFSTVLRQKDRKIDNYNSNYMLYVGSQTQDAGSIFAFEIGEIPFDLIRFKWHRLKNVKIKLTVLKSENRMKMYCENATVIIIPDLRL